MPQINCHLPIKLRIVGELSDTQLEQLGQTLVRTLQARIAFAQQTLRERGYTSGNEKIELLHERMDWARQQGASYGLPSYDDNGRPVQVPLVTSNASATDEEKDVPPPILPLLSDFHDYAFFFAGGAYGRAAEAYISQFHPEHHRFQARSFEQMFHLLANDIRQRTRQTRRPIRISEIVIVTHANAAGGMLIPLTNDRRKRTFSPHDLPSLQTDFRNGLYRRFRQDRREVVAALSDNTQIVVRGCNFGQSQEAIDSLRVFFGGQPYVWAPTGFQGFEVLPIGRSFLRTPVDAFDFLVQQGYLPEDQLELAKKEKEQYIRNVFGADARIPATFFIMGEEDYRAFKQLAPGQRLQEAAEPLIRRPFEADDPNQENGLLGVNTPSRGTFWGLSTFPALGYDRELDAAEITIAEIEARARRLNNPYHPRNAAMLLRLAAAWTRKQLTRPLSDSNDPPAGLPPFNIFGDSNILAGDAARFPGPPPSDLFESETLPARIISAEERQRTQAFREVQETLEAAAGAGLPSTKETTISRGGQVEEIINGIRLWDFAVGSAQLRSKFKEALNKLAQQAHGDPALGFAIEGHTSASGTEQGNEQLSQQRALAVQQFLIDAGASPDRMITFGFGKSKPLAPERVRGQLEVKNAAHNRRVDIIRKRQANAPPITDPTSPSTLDSNQPAPSVNDPALTMPELRINWKEYSFPLGKAEAGPVILSGQLKLKIRGSARYGKPTTKITINRGQSVVDFEKKFQSSFGEFTLKGKVEPGKVSQLAVGVGVTDWFDIEFAANGDLTKLYQVSFKIRPVEGEFTYDDWVFKGTIEGSLEINIGPNPEWLAKKALQSTGGRAIVSALARAGTFARGLVIAESLGTITVVGAVGIGVGVALAGITIIGLGLYMIGKAGQDGRKLGAGFKFSSGYASMLATLTSAGGTDAYPVVYADIPASIEDFHRLLNRDWRPQFDEYVKRWAEDEDRQALDELFEIGEAAVLQDWQQFVNLYSPEEWLRFAAAQRIKYGERYSMRKETYIRILYRQVREEATIGIALTPVR